MIKLTAVEKIISNHVGKTVRAGEMTIANVDLVMAQDGNAPLVIQILYEKLNVKKTFDASKIILVIDHCGPSPNEGASNMQQSMRKFATDSGAILYDAGEGISHVLLPEKGHIFPGALVVGSDSHTVTYGALDCLATGLGATDIAVAMYTGKVWLRVPETYHINLEGELPANVSAKDLVLKLIKEVGVNYATYKCLEVDGPGLATLNMDARFTLCNMAVEVGAKCMLMPVDSTASHYLAERMSRVPSVEWSDQGCAYEIEHKLDLTSVEPLVAIPHDLTRIVPVRQVIDQKINIAFVGTCTNSRLSDIREAAMVLKGRKVDPHVRLIVNPGSRRVYLDALSQGLIETIMESGGIILPPGCGPCVGTHMGIPGNNEVVISTANRNFKGRMGNRNASIYLASPATVAASAISGKIATKTEIA